MRNLARHSVALFSVVLSVAVLGAAIVGAGVLSGSEAFGVQASDSRELYVVHGLNLDGQTSQGDGGTNATVCIGATELVPDLEFGEIVGPIDVPSEFSALLYLQSTPGVPVDCGNPEGATALIDQTIEGLPSDAGTLNGVPNPDDAVAMIAAGQDTPEFVLVPLGFFCYDVGVEGELAVVHAASAGPIEVTYVGTVNPGTREYAWVEIIGPTYPIEVMLDGDTVFGPLETFVSRYPVSNRSVVYVVGNRPGDPRSPVVGLHQKLFDGFQCPGTGPPSLSDAETPSAVPVVATPAFTG